MNEEEVDCRTILMLSSVIRSIDINLDLMELGVKTFILVPPRNLSPIQRLEKAGREGFFSLLNVYIPVPMKTLCDVSDDNVTKIGESFI